MNDYIAFSAYFGAALTLIIYVVSFRISDRIGHPLANPILICLALLIGALLIFDIDYDAYNQSARYITYLLTPATACLALPLYRQIQKLREYPLAIVAGILTGVAVNALCVLAVALVFRLGHYDFVTLIPKSVTGAVGMPLAEELVFRGALLRLLRPLGEHPANLCQTVLFAALHGTLTEKCYALGMGLIFGWAAEQTESPAPGVVLHILNNGLVLARALAERGMG